MGFPPLKNGCFSIVCYSFTAQMILCLDKLFVETLVGNSVLFAVFLGLLNAFAGYRMTPSSA